MKISADDLDLIVQIAGLGINTFDFEPFDPLHVSDHLLELMKRMRIGVAPPCYGSTYWSAEMYIPNTEENLSHKIEFCRDAPTMEEAVVRTALAYAKYKIRKPT